MQFGSFHTLRELHRSQHAVLFSARRDGDEDPEYAYAVKIYDVESVGLLESVAAGDTFVQRALIQKKLADQGAKHWAPVLDMGTDEEPYYVTELFPLTAQRVINRQANVGAAGLFTVVSGVVRGLTELREMFRRAHGNLKLTNILIGDDEKLTSPKTTRVMLTDPSIEAASAKDRSADLLATGELIHQLVLRQPFRAAPTAEHPVPPEPQYPVPMSLAWQRLGPQAQDWLDLCNWLLSPRPADRPADLIELSVALHRLTPRVQRVKPKYVVMALVPLILAGVGIGFFYNTHANLNQQVQQVERQWLGRPDHQSGTPLEQQEQDWLARLQQAATKASPSVNDAGIRDVGAALTEAHNSGLHFDVSGDSYFSYSAYKNAQAVLDLSQRLEADLSPEKWTRLTDLSSLQQKYQSRGWTQPAMFLGDLLQQVRLSNQTDLPAGVAHLLEFAEPNEAWLQKLEENYAKFDADLQTAERTGDKALLAFGQRLRESVGESIRFESRGIQGRTALTDRLELVKQLAAVAKNDWPQRVDRQLLAEQVESRINLNRVTDAEIRQWLAAIDQYVLVPLDPNAEPIAGLKASFAKVTADVAKQALTPEEQAQYHTERDHVEQAISKLTETKFVQKDVARGEGQIPIATASIQHDLDALRKQWVRLDDPKQWVAFIGQPLATASDVLKSRWRGYVAKQEKEVDALAKDPATFKKVKADAEALRLALTELDKQFPPVPPGLAEKLAAAAWEKREQSLGALSTWAEAKPGGASPAAPEADAFAAQRTSAANGFAVWCGKLRPLAKDFPITKEVLTAADRPDVAWATKEKAFWEDPLVQAYVKDDLARISALGAVAKMNRADLLTAVRGNSKPEIIIAAYHRLGETATGTPTWPATEQELAAELEVRNRTAEQINSIRDDAERKPLGEEWLDQGPIRWRRFTNLAVLGPDGAASLQRRLAIAEQYRQAMHPKRAVELDKLDPAVRFNYTLYETRIAITDPTDAVVRRSADELNRAVAAVKDRREVQDLAKRLARVNEAEPMSVDAKLLAPQPPETYSIPGRDGTELKFARLAPAGQRPFYLCTTELSLGQFVDLVMTGGNWEAANTLLGNVSIPGGQGPTPMRGPRAWQRPASADRPISRFVTWQFDGSDGISRPFDFSPELRQYRFNHGSLKAEFGGDPKYDHPMQQISAQAALYVAAANNLRLPSSREWLAAYEVDRKAAPDGAQNDWNLRDRTWQAQWDFATRQSPGQWPDAQLSGIFWPASQKVPTAVNARPTSDRTLLFRSVNVGSGTFQNLVGNVAELVCEDADDLDIQPDRKTADGIRKFCKAKGSQIGVIGGSAMSAPELELLHTYPVNSAAEPYADVGVRLAFSAPARTVAERLKWSLDEQAFLTAGSARAEK